MPEARYFIVESFNRLVKVIGVAAWVYLDGQWHESAPAWRRVQGIGGDADSHEITAAEAAAFQRREGGAG